MFWLLSDRFYIGCDECGGWFHGACVGVSPTDVGRMDGYRCRVCCLKRDCDGVVIKEEKQWTGLKKLISMLKVTVISYGLVSEQINKPLDMVFGSTVLSSTVFLCHSFFLL